MSRRHEIIISTADRYLLWFAQADMVRLRACTYSARLALQSVGLSVIATTLLIAAASTYAIDTLLFDGDTLQTRLACILLGGIFAGGVMLFYRWVLSLHGRTGLVMGMTFAVFFLGAVYVSIEMKLFEGPIAVEVNSGQGLPYARAQVGVAPSPQDKLKAWRKVVNQNHETFGILRLFLVMALLMLQIAPFMVKWGFGYTEYDRLLECVSAIKKQQRLARRGIDADKEP